nr:T9SS type A sorting domain-containing protein [candidate division Zixibacteria bacterium]
MNHGKGIVFPLIVTVLIIMAAIPGQAATVVWNNLSGGNWNNASNWSTGTVPTSGDIVYITMDGNYIVNLDMNATVHTLYLGGYSGTQTLRCNSWEITVTGTCNVYENGYLDINSSHVHTTGDFYMNIDGQVDLDNGSIEHRIINKGSLNLTRTCSFPAWFVNDTTGTLTVEGNMEASCYLTVDTGFTNRGTINLTSSYFSTTTTAKITVTNGSLVNEAPGTINALQGSSLTTSSERTLEAQVANAGTINSDTYLKISKIDATHTNSGTYHVQVGNLVFTQLASGATFNNTGTIQIDSGCSFAFDSDYFNHLSGSIVNNGTLSFNGVVVAITPKFTNTGRLVLGGVSSSLTISDTLFNEGTISIGNAFIEGTPPLINRDSLLLTNGTVNVDLTNDGIIKATIAGIINGTLTTEPGSKMISEGTTTNLTILSVAESFTNHGEIILTQSATNYSYISILGSDDSLINASDGIITAEIGTGSAYPRYISAKLYNEGTVNVATTSSLIISASDPLHTNVGTINVTSGNLTCHDDFKNSGTINIAASKMFSRLGGKFYFDNGTVTGEGTLSLIDDTIYVSNSNTVDADVNFTGGLAENTGTLTNTGTLDLYSITVNGAGTIVNEGLMTMYNSTVNNDLDNGGMLSISRLNNLNGAVTNGIDDTILVQGDSYGSASLTVASGFTNNGVIDLTSIIEDTATTATLNVTSGALTNSNLGEIVARRGSSTGGTRILAAQLANQGEININNIALRMNKASISHTNNGTINVNSGHFYVDMTGANSFNNTCTLNFSNLMTMTVDGGTFNNSTTGKIQGNGSLNTYATTFTNDGRVSPGNSAGIINMQTNNFPIDVNGQVDIDLGGLTPITQHDILNITQNAVLGGVLNINLIYDFIPAVNDSFRVMTYNARIGDFLAILGLNQFGIVFDTNFTSSALYIVTKEVTNDPPVITGMPDSISFDTDSTGLLGIWNYVSDDYTSDTDIVYEFTVSNDSLLYDLNEAGFLILSAVGGFIGEVVLGMTVTDQHGDSASDTTIVTVTTMPNTDPVITGLPDSLSFKADSSYNLYIWGYVADTESDDSLLDYDFTTSSDSLIPAYDTSNGILNVSSVIGYNNTAYLYMTVTDPGGLTANDTVKFVIRYNYAPIISGLPDSIAFGADSSAVLDIYAAVSDAESDDSLIYYAFSASNDSLLRDFSYETGLLTLTASAGYSGEVYLYIAITDPDTAIAHDTIVVTVEPFLDVNDNAELIPERYALNQNYPNPFNPITIIGYSVPTRSVVNITVFDLLGRQVITLVDETRGPGTYTVEWNGSDQSGYPVASGLYFYCMKSGDYIEKRKMILLK